MNSFENVLSFMDLLDLDEELIDTRLKCIMFKDKYTNKHLINALQLLHYKQLVNVQDQSDCDNEVEYEFAVKLIKETDEENVDVVCHIVGITLGLNVSTLRNKSEHLIQQILSNIELPAKEDKLWSTKTLTYLKICNSILNTVKNNKEKLTLPFLEVPIKCILSYGNEKLKIYFLNITVPRLFELIIGYNILDVLWNYLKTLAGDKKQVLLKVLSSLSDYYLPVPDVKGNILFESTIVCQLEFWQQIFNGLLSNDPYIRKISIYLAKRALDCIIALKKDILIQIHEDTIFYWRDVDKMNLKTVWDNFFVLMDSLEEKQSNIVLPSLQLFESLKSLGGWLNCAFNVGLTHDNTQVRLKCIQHRLQIKLRDQTEAIILLEALNDINTFDDPTEAEDLKKKILTFVKDPEVFTPIIRSIPYIKWLPVPFFHLTSILSDDSLKSTIELIKINVTKIIIDILKVPCNSIPLRKAAFINISHFAGNCFSVLHWNDYINVNSYLHQVLNMNKIIDNPFVQSIKRLYIDEANKKDFFQFILSSHEHIDYGVLYLNSHVRDLPIFLKMLTERINTIRDIVSRQYSDKNECLNEVIYVTKLLSETSSKHTPVEESINILICRELKSILHYIIYLLSDNIAVAVTDMSLLCDGLNSISTIDNDINEVLLLLYKTCIIFIKDKDTVIESAVLCLFILNSLSFNQFLVQHCRHEMLRLDELLKSTMNFKNNRSIGRLRNLFYEKSCMLVSNMINELNFDICVYIRDVAECTQYIVECGGFGCLKYCLKIMIAILPFLINSKDIKLDIEAFITTMWREIEELKSNSQYSPCMEEFIKLIMHEELLNVPMYNNTVIFYSQKIIEYGPIKSTPLYYLVLILNSKNINKDYGQLIYILSEILLYFPVPRKDQRILENLAVQVIDDSQYAMKCTDAHFNFQIQYMTILALSKITDAEILLTIESFIIKRIDEAFRSKQRYHGHSQPHRTLLTALQHMLFILLMRQDSDSSTLCWCVELLGRLPHQPSVRTCLEWYIALYFYIKKTTLNEKVMELLKDVPTTSQFLIIFWTLKHKMKVGVSTNEEFEFVIDVLLSSTMGQMFNVRLYAQYLATQLYQICRTDKAQYSYIIKVIEKTFVESAKDKNFVKLQQDYFVNEFDILADLTPSFVYYVLPRYCEINNNELVNVGYIRNILDDINGNISAGINKDIFDEWVSSRRSDDEMFGLSFKKDAGYKAVEGTEPVGTIQKKYIPWKNMSDINMYESGKKRDCPSELIVVASLIDKLPNLGGMARTSEVFGVQTYVIDSRRHLQDRQFQGLSVSAERWVDVEEVRPGPPLKEYLMRMKTEGYTVVAAEQTSTSCKLQAFKFPKKTLLLLGHEKEGIPCDLLPVMDFCVEIPQQGFVRSLNVHVTAAIFIWEYARQNFL